MRRYIITVSVRDTKLEECGEFELFANDLDEVRAELKHLGSLLESCDISLEDGYRCSE